MLILYSLTAAPPLYVPMSHYRPRLVAVRSEVFSAKLSGASGLVMIVAPVPIRDTGLSPLIFVAITLTLTKSSRFKEKGEVVKLANGTVHSVAEMIELSEPSQFVSCSVNVKSSDSRIRI